jgi:DNA-binding NarL/FixJ family response regulator
VPLEGKNHLLIENEPAWERCLDEIVDFISKRPAASAATSDKTVPLQLAGAFTKREGEVLELIAQGYDNRQIARRLSISPKTVRNHVSHVYSKLQVRNRAQAIIKARQAGLGRRSA